MFKFVGLDGWVTGSISLILVGLSIYKAYIGDYEGFAILFGMSGLGVGLGRKLDKEKLKKDE